MPHQEKKWVIVFLIYADFRTNDTLSMNEEMKIELNCLFQDILTVPIKPDLCKIFVVLNSIKYLFKEDNQNWIFEDKTVLYEISNEKVNNENGFLSCTIINNKYFDIDQQTGNYTVQKTENLSKVLQNIHFVEDDEVFIITWDHGSAFGIFREQRPILSSLVNYEPINEHLEKYHYIKRFWDRAMQEESFNVFVNSLKKDNFYIFQSENKVFKISVNHPNANLLVSLLSEQSKDILQPKNFLNKYIKSCYDLEAVSDLASAQVLFAINGDANLKQLLQGTEVTEILTNTELADSLSHWLKNKRVGVLLMMNCWMMNLHTIYSMKGVVEFLVAPQGNIANPGYNYKDILLKINNPFGAFVEPYILAEECVRTSYNSNALHRARNLNKLNPTTIDSWAIFAMYLQKKDKDGVVFEKYLLLLKEIIVLFNSILEKQTNLKLELLYMVKYVRSLCYDFTENECFMIDITNFLSSLAFVNTGIIGFPRPIPISIINKIINLLNLTSTSVSSLILEKYIGKAVYNTNDALTARNPTGYSLFFPHGKFKDSNLIDNISKDTFLTESINIWKSLLLKIYPDINFT